MKNHWSRTDDEKVALHYLRHGDTEYDKLIAELPHHKPSSVRMRVANFKALDGGGSLDHTSAQERDVWKFASAVRDAHSGTPLKSRTASPARRKGRPET